MIRPVDPESSSEAFATFDENDVHGDRYLPARMINEAHYCPQLFCLMHVEGQFAHNADTTAGDGDRRM